MFNSGLFVVTETELIKQVLLAQCFFGINVASPALSLLILLLVSDQQLFNLLVNHHLSLGLRFFTWLVVEQSCRLDAEVRSIALELLEQGDVRAARVWASDRPQASPLVIRLLHSAYHA